MKVSGTTKESTPRGIPKRTRTRKRGLEGLAEQKMQGTRRGGEKKRVGNFVSDPRLWMTSEQRVQHKAECLRGEKRK